MITSLGIDGSLTGTGIVILQDGKIIEQRCIKSKPSGDKPINELNRIRKIIQDIEITVKKYHPNIALIENLAFGIQKTISLTQLAGLSYFCRAMLTDNNIPFVMVAPNSLKKFATGNGMSKKDIVMMEIYKRYNVTILDNNEADAYILAQIGLALLGGNSKATTKIQQQVVDLLRKQL